MRDAAYQWLADTAARRSAWSANTTTPGVPRAPTMWERTLALAMLLALASAQGKRGEPWFKTQPLLALLVAESPRADSEQGACADHIQLFRAHLENYTLWAVQMFDSSTKLPEGVVDGHTYQMGHYDECVRVSAGDVKGQYCLVELSYQPVDYQPSRAAQPFQMTYDPHIHVWEKLKSTEDYRKTRKDAVHWALCVPASCGPGQLQSILDRELAAQGKSRDLQLSAEVSPSLCSVEETPPPFSAAEIAYLSVVGILLLLLVTSTVYDIKNYSSEGNVVSVDAGKSGASLATRLLLCFSARRSLKSALTTRVSHPATEASNGPRVIIMVLMIFGHRLLMFIGHPVSDAYYLDDLFCKVQNAFVANGPLLVDSYMVVGGLLLALPLLQQLNENKAMNVGMVLLIRFIRLTPVYAMVVFFHATVFYRMGSGPFWKEIIGTDRDRCQANWWTNLLYINNFVNVESMCMFQSWYLSYDFQMMFVSLLLIYAIWRWSWLGYPALVLLYVASVVVPFLVVLLNKADPILLPIARYVQDPVNSWYFQNIYVKTYNRAFPYLSGVTTGLIIFKMRSSKFKLGKLTSHVLFSLLVWVLGTATMLAAYVFFDPARPYNALESALYASLHRVGFGVSIASYFLLIHFGQLDGYVRLFSWKPFKVLSRLTYGVYLVHTASQLYDHGTLRSSRPTQWFSILWMTMSDCTFAFGVAFFLLILVEAPFRAMEKILLGRK